jgi:hypothetical protein
VATFNKNFRTKQGITSEGNVSVTGELTATGDVVGQYLRSSNSSGDEGGEILLYKPATNSTIAGTGVTIDIWQNRLRFFEQGGTARGYYLDITAGGAGVGTNLAAGGGGTTTNPLTIGTGLSGTSFNGSAAVTIAIDSTVATLTGSQTLTNKTINGSNNTITNISLTTGVTGTLPVANGGTGITSLGSGIATFLGTPSSANLSAAVTDETGSGALVFGTTPTINTPLLTLSTTSSTTEGRIAWDSTNDKILVGGTLNSVSQAIEFASSTLNISTPTFTTNAYTVVLTDKDKWLELSNGATAGTLNIPTDASVAFPIGTQLNIIQTNTGQITIAAVTPGTTTINGTPGLKLRERWSSATIIKRAANSWVAVGDLSA